MRNFTTLSPVDLAVAFVQELKLRLPNSMLLHVAKLNQCHPFAHAGCHTSLCALPRFCDVPAVMLAAYQTLDVDPDTVPRPTSYADLAKAAWLRAGIYQFKLSQLIYAQCAEPKPCKHSIIYVPT